MQSILSGACWPYVCLLRKNAYSGPLPIFNGVVDFFDIELYEFLFWILAPYWTLQIFSPTRFAFFFVDDFLCCAKAFKFD